MLGSRNRRREQPRARFGATVQCAANALGVGNDWKPTTALPLFRSIDCSECFDDQLDKRCGCIGFREPTERGKRFGALVGPSVVVGGRKDAADVEFAEQLPRHVDPITGAGKADVHDGQRGTMFPGNEDGFFRGRSGADDIESGVSQSIFRLHRNQKVILDDQDPGPLSLLVGCILPPAP
jgi:hypothetical protein